MDTMSTGSVSPSKIKTKDTRCRTCIKTASSYLSLQQEINEVDNHSKTYGELLKDILQLDCTSVLEDQLPQKICKKCASLLKRIHKFVILARKRHEEFILCSLTTQNCLKEIPIDLPLLNDVQIKADPDENETPQQHLLELVEVQIKTEPEVTEILWSETEKADRSFTTNVKLNRAKTMDKNTLSNCRVENISSDATDVSSAVEDDVAEEFNLPLKALAVRCDVCDKVYENAAALKKHKTYTHMPDEQKIPCALCNFKTSRTSAIKVHLRNMHGPETVDKYFKPITVFKGSFCCTLCPKRYSRKGDLQRHVKQVHINGENIIKNPKSARKTKKGLVRTYLCTFCGQSFGRKSTLSTHVRIHTDDRPYKCEFCEKTFKSLVNLKYHLVTHSDEKPHTCSECGKSFNRKDKLRRHMRVHSDLRRYKCSECEKSFKYSCVLKTHMQIHLGRDSFASKFGDDKLSLAKSLSTQSVPNEND
ncbi:hypothetical protein GQX74_000147 [Glossina fuscipes]|nr:hypothetical protein GQX74_000147 [Glossina fuscipes]